MDANIIYQINMHKNVQVRPSKSLKQIKNIIQPYWNNLRETLNFYMEKTFIVLL